MKLFTVGYGGRTKEELLNLLKGNGVRTVVDVRLRPDRSSMGLWVKAKTPDKGIEKTLTDAGIGYYSFVELGNIFLDFIDWKDRYGQLLAQSGKLLIDRLTTVPKPFCLLCAEKRASECHRKLIADYLAHTLGAEVKNLE